MIVNRRTTCHQPLAAALAAVLVVGGIPAAAQPGTRQVTTAEAADALKWARRVADWQLARRGDFTTIPRAGPETKSARDWQQAAFYIGLTMLADRTGERRYVDAVLANGRTNRWGLSPRTFHADDQSIAATYIWASRHGAPPEAVVAIRARADAIIAAAPKDDLTFPEAEGQPGCQRRWCWSDALFMAPPVWFALTRATGDQRYADYADREFRTATAFLFDPQDRLYYRDSRFFTRRGADGEKLYWARGNGWAFAGLTRILDILPPRDPRRGYYEALFRTMAARLIVLQKPDGYWAPSLLATGVTAPESSGTGFFVHGLAWGINHGLLDRRATLPAVERGWQALTRAVQTDGMVGWVQQVSDRPDAVAATDTQYYGVGAFLLAATQVADLSHNGGRR
ncbi:glycoside hydrolase family 88/105 protein [Sphingomonas sp. RS2018]